MPDDEIILGIDLGTTFSVAAYVDDYGRPTVIPSAEGENTTPSVILIENGKVLVGAAAAGQAIVKQGKVIQWIKRSMGDLDFQFEGLGPIELSAEILKKIKADCETFFADRGARVSVSKAVITCPAYFSAIEVENTMKAGQLAGLEVKEIVREPTAAAVYYGVEHLKEGGRLLVCDLGGGTFDASILTLEQGTFRPLSTAGDRQLGGHDWTSDLLKYVGDNLTDLWCEDPRIDASTEQFLYESCERLKRDFAQSDQGVIICSYKGKTAQVSVTRAEFERLTEWRIREVLDWAEKALGKADPPLNWKQIDDILLVGGATRMRRVSEALTKLAGKKPIQTAEADTMVALGAAILAKGAYRPRRAALSSGIKKSVVSGLTLIDFKRTAPRNFGTKVMVRMKTGLEIQNSVIIPYGTDLPAQKSREDYRTVAAGPSCFDVPVVEFDDIGPEVIQQAFRFDCPAGLPKGIPVHITFRYDQSGQMDVEAVEHHTHMTLTKSRVPYQEPTIAPRRIIFALDVSGSMNEYHKIDRALQALLDNAREILASGRGQTEIGVVAFGSKAQVVCPPTLDLQALETAVARVSTYGTTAMDAGLALALDLLKNDTKMQRQILLISDGMPDQPQQVVSIVAQIQAEGIPIAIIDIGTEGINEAFLKDLSISYLHLDGTEGLSGAITSLLLQESPSSSVQSGVTWLGANGT